MIFKYGSYAHSANEVSLTVSKQAEFSDLGYRRGTRETWTIAGVLQGGSQTEITSAIAALQTAYGTNGLNAGLYLDDGMTVTAHFLDSSATRGGVNVKSVSFPQGKGAEYSTFRTYQVVLEALFPEEESVYLSWTESISTTGTGGPKFILVPLISGAAQKQIVQQNTVVKVSQRGSATGVANWPSPAAPLFPDYEKVEQRSISRDTPRMHRTNNEGYRVSWSYAFEDGAWFSANPTTL